MFILNNENYNSAVHIYRKVVMSPSASQLETSLHSPLFPYISTCSALVSAQVLCVAVLLSEGCADLLLGLQKTKTEVILTEEGQRVPAQMPAQR
jgi:hypothetical protein